MSQASSTSKPDPFDTTHLQDGLRSRSLRGGAVTLVAQGSKFVLRTAAIVVLARILTPDDFGVFAKVLAIVAFAGLVREMGIAVALAQRETLTHELASTIVWINAALSLGVAGCVAAIGPLLALFYDDDRVTALTLLLAFSTLLGGLAVPPTGLLRRQMRFRVIASVEVVAMTISLVAAIVAALLGAGYWALGVQHAVQQGVQATGLWWRCGWRPGRPRRVDGAGRMLAFGGRWMGVSLLNAASRQFDMILIGKLYGAASLGHYSRAFSLVLLPQQQLVVPLGGVAMPMLARLRNEPERFQRGALSVLRLVAMVTALPVALLIGVSDWAILLLLGPQWDLAGRLFGLLAFVALVHPICLAMNWIFLATDRDREVLRGSIWVAVGTLLAIGVGLAWGPMGVAAALAIFNVAIRLPGYLWWTAHATDVTFTVLFAALRTPAALVIVIIAASHSVRRFAEIEHAAFGVFVAALAAGAAVLLALAAPPIRRDVSACVGAAKDAVRRRRAPQEADTIAPDSASPDNSA